MGYRNYFSEVNKSFVDDVRNLSVEEFVKYAENNYPETVKNEDNELYVSIVDMIGKSVFEFGKLYWDDTIEQIQSTGKPLFTDKNMLCEYEDYNIYVVGKEGVLRAIKIYQNKVKSWYEELLKKDSVDEIKSDLKSNLDWWNRGFVIDTTEDKNVLSGSWLYEHSIFNLVNILKHTDWKTRVLLFYGY